MGSNRRAGESRHLPEEFTPQGDLGANIRRRDPSTRSTRPPLSSYRCRPPGSARECEENPWSGSAPRTSWPSSPPCSVSLASVAVLWYERRVPRRKRIGYRVQLDTPIGSDAAQRPGQRAARAVQRDPRHVRRHARPAAHRERRLAVASPATTTPGAESTASPRSSPAGPSAPSRSPSPPDADHLMEHFTPAAGLRHSDGIIHLPRVPLNRGEHFKLLVLLTGGGVGERGQGHRRYPGRRGEAQPQHDPGRQAPGLQPGRPARSPSLLTVVRHHARLDHRRTGRHARRPSAAPRGTLTVTGSTAFAPVVRELAKKYEKDCEGSGASSSTRTAAPPGYGSWRDEGAKAGRRRPRP